MSSWRFVFMTLGDLQGADNIIDGGIDIEALIEGARAVVSAAFDGLHEDKILYAGDRIEPLGGLEIMEILLNKLSRGYFFWHILLDYIIESLLWKGDTK